VKLASYTVDGRPSYGIVTDEGIRDVGSRLARPSLREALRGGADLSTGQEAAPLLPLGGVQWLPPMWDSDRNVCVGLNYRTHIEEMKREFPPYPMLFIRWSDSLVGSGEPIVRPSVSERFDFEGEFAVVIGRGGRHIREEDALDHVLGYTIVNDGTIRDFQRHTTQYFPGKSFWHSGASGPWIVTPDETGPYRELTLQTRVNGELMQDARLDDLVFDVEQLIAYVSTVITLQPGDLISTGTTGGVGDARSPQLWLRPGDTVEITIDRVGTLVNPVIDESSTS
jgi:2-keto-4-pentenoate hydratase/2-oxohepta-3-ene-1,7-dioic acid hydratase in catechol pathway